jgi:hypothetical protein
MFAESVGSYIGNTEAEDEQPRDQPDLVPKGGPSTSSCSRTGQVKRNLSDRSEGLSSGSSGSSDDSSCSGRNRRGNDNCNKSSSSKTPQSKRRKSVKRLANIGKKFFCFK